MKKGTRIAVKLLGVVVMGLFVVTFSANRAEAGNPYCSDWYEPFNCAWGFNNDGWTCLAACDSYESGCLYCCTAWEDPAYGVCQDYCESETYDHCWNWCFAHCPFWG